MTIGRIRKGDVLRIDVRGQRSWAVALEDGRKGLLLVAPHSHGVLQPAIAVKPREIIGHWRPRKGSVI